ncbi:MAG: hypothetical protein HKN47_28475 [Pirellulaceae bacterium]|nr:hypothetical protein [Pirellulaceae bacterium]
MTQTPPTSSNDDDQSSTRTFAQVSTDPVAPVGPAPSPYETIYKAPQRFDLATVFVVTFAYAALFGAMQAFGAPVIVQASIIGVLTIVAIVQMLVPERYARWAAIATGCAIYFAAMLANQSPASLPIAWLTPGVAFAILFFGAILGYCAGVVVAGVFLVADVVRRFTRWLMQNVSRTKPADHG